MKHSRLIALLAFFTIFSALSAQNPIRWRTLVNVDEAGTGTITFRALVEPGWHLYGLEMPEGGPKATSFELSGKGLEFTGKIKPSRKPVVADDPMFGMPLSWWDSKVEFTVPVRLTAESGTFECKITFMACDGTTCRPPVTEAIAGTVKPKQK